MIQENVEMDWKKPEISCTGSGIQIRVNVSLGGFIKKKKGVIASVIGPTKKENIFNKWPEKG